MRNTLAVVGGALLLMNFLCFCDVLFVHEINGTLLSFLISNFVIAGLILATYAVSVYMNA